jgi:Putative auto-transporter adhesin, head GIN domain
MHNSTAPRLWHLLAIALLLVPTSPRAGNVTASGRIATENRVVPTFRAIALHGSMNVVVRQSGKDAVEVRADDKLLPLIETRVVDRSGVPTLEIDTKTGWNISGRSQDMVVTVEVATLEALAVSGSGTLVGEALRMPRLKVVVAGSGGLRLPRITADDLAIKVSGSGDVEAGGRAGRLSIAIAGSGNVKARELEGDEVSVSIAGSGNAAVQARKSLAVSIAGSGDVRYVGDATVKTAIAGSGTVTKAR